jgi:deoxyribonuclease-1
MRGNDMKFRSILAMCLASTFSIATLAGADTIDSFSEAKRVLYTKVYKANENNKEFYCGCDIKRQGKKLVPDLESCGYENRKESNLVRAERIEAEHIVPAAHIGYQNQCMIDNKSRKDKRAYCEKNDPSFRQAYIDLHNLVPAVGEVNLDRSNFRYAALQQTDFVYGQCDMKIDFKAKAVQPPANVRGDVARTYFYMSDRYGIKISDSQRKLFEVWAKQDPVDEWERVKNKRIKDLQGNSNKFIEDLD